MKAFEYGKWKEKEHRFFTKLVIFIEVIPVISLKVLNLYFMEVIPIISLKVLDLHSI